MKARAYYVSAVYIAKAGDSATATERLRQAIAFLTAQVHFERYILAPTRKPHRTKGREGAKIANDEPN